MEQFTGPNTLFVGIAVRHVAFGLSLADSATQDIRATIVRKVCYVDLAPSLPIDYLALCDRSKIQRCWIFKYNEASLRLQRRERRGAHFTDFANEPSEHGKRCTPESLITVTSGHGHQSMWTSEIDSLSSLSSKSVTKDQHPSHPGIHHQTRCREHCAKEKIHTICHRAMRCRSVMCPRKVTANFA